MRLERIVSKMEIVIRENGEMVGVGYNSNANAWFRTHGPVPPDHPTRKALEVGRSLIELAEKILIAVRRPAPIEPPEPVGVEFLRQLLSRVVYYDKGWKEAPFVVTELGLMWISWDVEDPIWHWNGTGKADRTDWREQDWVRNASPKTIQVWTPEENNNADK